MVSLNSIITIGGLGAAALIYFKYGGLSGIGQALGGSIGGFGQGITQGLNQFRLSIPFLICLAKQKLKQR